VTRLQNDYENTILVYDHDNVIAYIEGTENHINGLMVLPYYQGGGIGRKLLKEYMEIYAKNHETYNFNTSIILDSLKIHEKNPNCKIHTDDGIIFTIECDKRAVFTGT